MTSSPAPAAIILFDGVCNLCNGFVQFVLEHDQQHKFSFAALQSPTGQRLLRESGLAPDQLSTIVVVEDGRARTKSDAILRIAGALGYPWKLLGATRVLPRPVRDAAYALVARNRYRLFGRRDECWLMTPELAGRFLK